MIKYSKERYPLIEPFIQYRKASDRWNDGDGKNLLYFDRYCGMVTPRSEVVTQEMVDGWCALRATENTASRFARTNIVVQFVRYLVDRGYPGIHDPHIPLHRHERNYVPHAFTGEELKRFFDECDRRALLAKGRSGEARALIPPALFRLLYSSGMRTVEMRLLMCDHIDLNAGVINVEYTKGREQHYVALHDSTSKMLKDYASAIDLFYPGRRYFFPMDIRKPLYQVWIPQTFRKIWDSVNGTHAIAYDLRHNYATENINRWIGQGLDFNDKFMTLSKSMGHTKLESTKYYYSIVPGLSQLMEEQTEKGFDELLPEVDDDEE